jgi:predicted metal-dependent hydrolase
MGTLTNPRIKNYFIHSAEYLNWPYFVWHTIRVEYHLKHSTRARRLRITIHPGGAVMVTAPKHMPQRVIDRFIVRHTGWIAKHVARQAKRKPSVLPRASTAEFKKRKAEALLFVRERITALNATYAFKFSKIVIRNQKTLWGSCSKQGVLSFNYRLIFLPSLLQDYIIVHELCHLSQMNHSPRFWNMVSLTVPNPKQVRRQFRTEGFTLR